MGLMQGIAYILVYYFCLMVWLLFRVFRDRPGILMELGGVLARHGVNVRNVNANSYAILIEAEGDVAVALPDIAGLRDVELVNIIDVLSPPITFAGDILLRALEGVLRTFGAAMVPFLYRLGYEYGYTTVTAHGRGMGAEEAIRTFLTAAMSRGRIVIRNVSISNGEVRVEVADAFDREFGLPFTRGYIHGLVNAATGKLHTVEVIENTIIAKPM